MQYPSLDLNVWGIGQSDASAFFALNGNMIVNILWVLRSTVEDSAPMLTLNITDNTKLIGTSGHRQHTAGCDGPCSFVGCSY